MPWRPDLDPEAPAIEFGRPQGSCTDWRTGSIWTAEAVSWLALRPGTEVVTQQHCGWEAIIINRLDELATLISRGQGFCSRAGANKCGNYPPPGHGYSHPQ